MPHECSAQNHDWDLTLRASHELLMLGQFVEKNSKAETSSKIFSCWTGSMLLSFCAIESFSASVAFSMPSHERFRDFDFKKYKSLSRFWDKIELLCGKIQIKIDKSEGLFQKIGEMQQWRNLVTHASPYDIPATLVTDTVDAPRKLHKPFKHKEDASTTNVQNAKEFHSMAFDYIELIKTRSGIDPRATASYKVG